LRKEQEEEVRIHERLRDYKKGLQDAEGRLADTNRRLSELRGSGSQTQTAEQLLTKLQKDVREIADRKEGLEISIADREIHLEKLHSWDSSDRMTTEDDVRTKRDQVRDMEDQVASLQESLEAALERNTKLVVFKQASTIALKKLREREDEVEKITEEKRRLTKHTEDKENELKAQGKHGGKGKMRKQDLKEYGAIVKKKIDEYKKMREELSQLRGELVVLQRTEQLLKGRDKNLDDFLSELERKKGIEVSRE
jgi:chromosome segregation ATPase